MKRKVLAMLLSLLMLTGCARREPVSREPDEMAESIRTEQADAAPETLDREEGSDAGEVPAPDELPDREPVAEEVPGQEMPAVEEPSAREEQDWAEFAAAAYRTIVDRESFQVQVWQEDDAYTDLVIQRGINDPNVQASQYGFEQLEWTIAASEDWIAMTQAGGYGPELCFYAGGDSFTCCEHADLVQIVQGGEVTYFRAAQAEADVCAGSLYEMLDMVAEDAVTWQVWNVTADGSLPPAAAAQAMAETVAENYRGLPEWVCWKPAAAESGSCDVFDIYWGEPQEFCTGLGLRLSFAEERTANDIHWQAGSGLAEPDADGWYGYGAEIWVRKNDAGDWAFMGRGTGGYAVDPQNTEGKPELEWLVELFCLTEGLTHDWRAPYGILDLDEEELAGLPALLDQLTEREARELCAVLGKNLREYPYWAYTVDTLKGLLGEYGSWLDA